MGVGIEKVEGRNHRESIKVSRINTLLYIIDLKRDYNKEFESLESFKSDIIFVIKEKND